MFKVQTILCVALAVIVGQAAAQLPAAPVPTLPADPVPAVAVYNLPTLKDIYFTIQNIIENQQSDLLKQYSTVFKEVKQAINTIDRLGASMQLHEQTVVMEEFAKIKEQYNADVAAFPNKNFSKCDAVITKIADFLNIIGQNLYVCHTYYSKTARHWGRRIAVNIAVERDYLAELKKMNCPIETATDAASQKAALQCLTEIGIQLLRSPRANSALTTITESVNAMITDQVRNWESCPAYANLNLFAQLKPGYLKTLKQCIDAAPVRA